FGIVLAEAMAAGCPLVASDLEAFRDVSQEGRSARLFTNEDAGSLGGEILTLLADQDLRQGLVAREKTRSQDFDWSTIADRIEGIYRRYC
ncbi:MAG: glycosyltransferase, partial [Parascardovia denticolens]